VPSATRLQTCLAFPAHIVVLCDLKVRSSNLFARRSTGKVGYVGGVKCVLGCRISPEDGEAEKLAREQPDRLSEKMRWSGQELNGQGEVMRKRDEAALGALLVVT
jgi:hypothetical protein